MGANSFVHGIDRGAVRTSKALELERTSGGCELRICWNVCVSTIISSSVRHYSWQLADLDRMSLGILYWFSRFRLLPRLRNSAVEKATVVLDDGTTVTKFIEVPRGRPEPDRTKYHRV